MGGGDHPDPLRALLWQVRSHVTEYDERMQKMSDDEAPARRHVCCAVMRCTAEVSQVVRLMEEFSQVNIAKKMQRH